MIRPLTAVLLSTTLVLTAGGFACDKKVDKAEFISYAKDIQNAFVAFGPTIQLHKPSLKPNWDKGTVIAGNLLTAVEASDKTTVLELVADLIPIVNATVAEFTDNSTALLILAGADIGIHFFVNHYQSDELAMKGKSTKSAARSDVMVIEEYRTKRAWGCDYRPERCKGLKKVA